MKDKINKICTELNDEKIAVVQATEQLFDLYNDMLPLNKKTKLDLLNWIKSEIAQETNVKLSKVATPYRSEKISFLNRLLKVIQ